HSTIFLSSPADATKRPSGENASDLIRAVCLPIVISGSSGSACHNRTVPSTSPVTSLLPLGEKATLMIDCSFSFRCPINLQLTVFNIAKPRPTHANRCPSAENATPSPHPPPETLSAMPDISTSSCPSSALSTPIEVASQRLF